MSGWSDYVAKLSPGLWLRLGDASGYPQDSSGLAHHSTYETMDAYNQAGALADDANGSIYFDGSSDLFAIPNHDDFEPEYDEDFTIAFWVKTSTTTAGLFIADYINAALTRASFRLYTQANGTIRLNRTDGTNAPTKDTPYAINDGNWRFVAFVKSRADLYSVAGTTWSGATTDTTASTVKHTEALIIGRGVSTGYFPGYLDEFIVIKSALSVQQLRDLYFLGKSGYRRAGPRRAQNISSFHLPRLAQ